MTNAAELKHFETCPKCGSDAATTWTKAADGGGYVYTCRASYAHDGDGHVTWVADPPKGQNAPTGFTTEGITTNLVDPLLRIMQTLPPTWIEYGVIEYQVRVDTQICSPNTSPNEDMSSPDTHWPRLRASGSRQRCNA